MKYSWIDKYTMEKKGVTQDFKQEWQWTRYMVGGKMFLAVCKNEEGQDFLITLKLEPSDGDFLRQQYEDITPGYYMNKIHWNSVNADGKVPDDLLKDMIDKSYRLVLGGLSKKMQKDILEGQNGNAENPGN